MSVFLVNRANAIQIIRSESVIKNNTDQSDVPGETPVMFPVGLKQVEVRIEDYRINVSKNPVQENYGTRAYFAFKTESVKDLSRFVWVQRIQGCKFDSFKMNDGSIEKSADYVKIVNGV